MLICIYIFKFLCYNIYCIIVYIFEKEGLVMDNSMVLNRVFTQNTFKELLNEDISCETYMSVIRRYASHVEDKNNAELISEIYSYMKKNYRNEYFYKNTLLNKLLLGVHKPTTTTALTEIPVGKSKADFILINGKAIVYEGEKSCLHHYRRSPC